jgi:hypothetical protein
MKKQESKHGERLFLLSDKELEFIIEQTVKRTAEEIGAIPKYLERNEVIKRLNGSRYFYDKGIKEGYLNPVMKGGKSSKVKILRTEVEKYEALVILDKS